MRERKGELSVLNVILALLVIFIHISSNPVSVLDKTQLPYMIVLTLWRLSQFVVQGFIFLSGLKMFLNKGDDFNYKKFYVSRFKNIVIPYILWVIIYYVYFWHHGYFLPDQNHASELAKYVLKGNLVSHFYFVVTIVQFYALAPVWVFVARKTKPVLSIAASLVITVIFAMFGLYKKDKRILLASCVPIIYLFTCFCGPMVALRYIYCIIVCMPILFYLILNQKNMNCSKS